MSLTRRHLITAASVLALPGAAWARGIEDLLGEFGTAADPLVIFERDGQLMVMGQGLTPVGLQTLKGRQFRAGPAGPTLSLGRNAVRLGETLLPRHDFGAEVQETIHRAVRANPEALRAAALAATPPVEPTPHRPSDLVEIVALDPSIRLDIRYAGSNNFMGIPIYERAAAWLQRPAAEALVRVQAALKPQGYGLLIHDAYRPWFATWMFWEATPETSHEFVADPAKGSRHNRGCAVDLTLVDLATGKAVTMPSRYDEMSPRAYGTYLGGTTRQRALRDLLGRHMTAEGFEVLPEEWWHFDYRDWAQYGIGQSTFTQLAETR